jgi:protein Tex
VKAGQIVKVQVLSADPKTKRIALSMKALMPPAAPPPKSNPRVSPEDQLAALTTRWKVR